MSAKERSAADPDEEVDRVLKGLGGTKVSAVISTDDYPGAALAAIIAKGSGCQDQIHASC